ncbi:uncharacterized protein LOC144449109 isoform X1 [Glandiceps talaboti]
MNNACVLSLIKSESSQLRHVHYVIEYLRMAAHKLGPGRPMVSSSAKKGSRAVFTSGKINIFGQIDRWKAIKDKLTLKSNREVAEFLINWYHDHKECRRGEPLPSTSHHATMMEDPAFTTRQQDDEARSTAGVSWTAV